MKYYAMNCELVAVAVQHVLTNFSAEIVVPEAPSLNALGTT